MVRPATFDCVAPLRSWRQLPHSHSILRFLTHLAVAITIAELLLVLGARLRNIFLHYLRHLSKHPTKRGLTDLKNLIQTEVLDVIHGNKTAPLTNPENPLFAPGVDEETVESLAHNASEEVKKFKGITDWEEQTKLLFKKVNVKFDNVSHHAMIAMVEFGVEVNGTDNVSLMEDPTQDYSLSILIAVAAVALVAVVVATVAKIAV
jgi:hypothetical protein